MFTGIVEKTARVMAMTPGPKFVRLVIPDDYHDVAHGESIAVNGVCLTVAELAKGELHFDVIAETLDKTNLGLLKTGDSVHVERSLRVGDRISGHFVQGHVDGPAKLVEMTDAADETRLRLQVSPALSPFIAPKGSVTLDGVSLTVAAVDGEHFEVALIPTTVQMTNLLQHDVGWPFNFEADIIGKTVVAYLMRTAGR
ncbi:MAG TPA: riboflavin synthase [Tepidisphaeraceae bacterium]|jgi:riboflavin synthase|nr:riboflavin synthase [Tepidisphaeraceae bacterium]